MWYMTAKDNMIGGNTMCVLSNLGNGPVAGDICLDHAIANIATFIKELDMKDPPVAVTMRSSKHDGTGRYQFDLHRGICTVDVDMPGVPLDEVQCTEGSMPPGCPRLYVDGSSWWWCYALGCAKDALEDHDGTVEQRLEISEQNAEAELDRQPRCPACNNVRSLVMKADDLWDVCCYTCDPEIETRRETLGGAVYCDDGWRSATHYLVRRQHMPPEVPGHDNPMHPDALCGAMRGWSDGSTSRCRLRSRHEGSCEPYWKEIERTRVMPDPGSVLENDRLRSVTVQDEGFGLANNPPLILNFAGAGVTVTDAGDGVALVTISGSETVQDEGVGPITTKANMTAKDSMIIGCIEHAERQLAEAEKQLCATTDEFVTRFHSGRVHATRDILVGLRNLATYVNVTETRDKDDLCVTVTLETGDIPLLPEITRLPRVELRAYALKRARRIVRETPGDSDAWCDPEEWQSEAVELAHAVARWLGETEGVT